MLAVHPCRTERGKRGTAREEHSRRRSGCMVVDADKKAGKMTFKVSERVGEKVVARAKK